MNIDIPISNLYEELIKLKSIGRKITCQPLGFYRIFIKPQDEFSPSLMLHAWLHDNQPKQSSDNDIHSHIFDMTSRIITGELVNEIYDVIDDQNGSYKLVRVTGNRAKNIRIVSDEVVSPKLLSSRIIKEGEKYGFESKIFHRSIISKYPTITLMEKDNRLNEDAVNLIRAGFQENEVGEFVEPEINQEEIWTVILEIIKSKFAKNFSVTA